MQSVDIDERLSSVMTEDWTNLKMQLTENGRWPLEAKEAGRM